MDDKTVSKVLLDVQKEYAKSNKIKDKIIMLLIVLMFAEAVVGYSGFVYYESQFETTTTEKIEVGTEGENATLISTLRPTPIPAYQTCSPYESAYMYSRCGNGYNNGCGC